MPKARKLQAAQALREAFEQAMAADPRVFMVGLGASDPKGIFGTTSGLQEKFGAARVIDPPCSESALTGIAIGAALMGQRPILSHQRVEFSLLALEQIIDNAAKMHYVSRGQHRVPVVIRMIIGRGWGQGAQHAQSLEVLYSHIPGLKVVMPVTPADHKGMMLAAIADDSPVIFLEHRWCHYTEGEVPVDPIPASLDGPEKLADGEDITVVATSFMVLEAMQAVSAAAKYGVKADFFDLRVLRPLNLAAILASVKRTGRLLFIDTGWTTYGIGAEVVAQATEQAFDSLRTAPRRLGLPEMPVPASPVLAKSYYVTAADIVDTILQMANPTADRQTARAELEAIRDKLPFDVPHPAFKGPF
jgi:pyruvate/2-oxoglutarate/acetoin dehydrogenase E1 component